MVKLVRGRFVHEIEVTSDGLLLRKTLDDLEDNEEGEHETEVTLADCPKPVRKTFNANHSLEKSQRSSENAKVGQSCMKPTY